MSTSMLLELTLDVSTARETGGRWLAIARETGVIARADSEDAAVEKNKRMHDIVFGNLRTVGVAELIKFIADRRIPFKIERSGDREPTPDPVWWQSADGGRNIVTRQAALV